MSFVRRYWAPFLFFGFLYWAYTSPGEAGAAIKGIVYFLLGLGRDFIKVIFEFFGGLGSGSQGGRELVTVLTGRSS